MLKNLFYFRVISRIGGTEQFLYEIAKKYKDLDITIYYQQADESQLKRLRKYVRCKKWTYREKVQCERAFFNFNSEMIDYVEAKKYYFISHANYSVKDRYIPPIDNKKITNLIGVSEFSKDRLQQCADDLKIPIKAQRVYNPLTLEPKEHTPILVSACRLNDEVKGGLRVQKLVQALDRYCKEHNRHYLWLIFTNLDNLPELPSDNVAYMHPRTDVRPYMQMADYVVQLSNDMETYCYTINEALGYGVPIVTTPLTICKELPITKNEQIVLDFDCSNVDEVAKQIFEKKVKPFKYEIPQDNWGDILVKTKGTYQKELTTIVEVECIYQYYDLDLGKDIKIGDKFFTNLARANELKEKGLIELCKTKK